MYAEFHPSPEAQARPKAIFYTVLAGATLLLALLLLTFTTPSSVRLLNQPVIDSVAVALIPLELAPAHRIITHATTGGSSSRSAAPVARWTPTPQPARPSMGPLPDNSQPMINSREPSPVETPKIDERGLYRKVDKLGNGNDAKVKTQEGGLPHGQPGGSTAGPGEPDGNWPRPGRVSIPS